tara:strand:- start:275 stop:556 length:282 start_codon:yes stop_codon:yes gene_type:complete
MTVKLVEIFKAFEYSNQAASENFRLREILINPDHVVYLRGDTQMGQLLNEGDLPKGLDRRQEFTRVFTSKNEFIVVGSPEATQKKLFKNILKG